MYEGTTRKQPLCTLNLQGPQPNCRSEWRQIACRRRACQNLRIIFGASGPNRRVGPGFVHRRDTAAAPLTDRQGFAYSDSARIVDWVGEATAGGPTFGGGRVVGPPAVVSLRAGGKRGEGEVRVSAAGGLSGRFAGLDLARGGLADAALPGKGGALFGALCQDPFHPAAFRLHLTAP